MLITIIPFLVLIAGLLMWVLASNAKVQEAGRLMFFSGVFVLTWHFAGETVRIGGR